MKVHGVCQKHFVKVVHEVFFRIAGVWSLGFMMISLELITLNRD